MIVVDADDLILCERKTDCPELVLTECARIMDNFGEQVPGSD